MSLILCPSGAVAETIQRKIAEGYAGLCAGIHSQDVGLEGQGFFPAWQGAGPDGNCTVVAAVVGPMNWHPQARSWMRELLEQDREDAA